MQETIYIMIHHILYQSFLDRGYPQTLVEQTLVRARRQDRDSLLQPKTEAETKEQEGEKIHLITTFNPGRNVIGEIINKNVPYVTKNPKFRDFNSLKKQNVYRRPKNLRDLLVSARLPAKGGPKLRNVSVPNVEMLINADTVQN